MNKEQEQIFNDLFFIRALMDDYAEVVANIEGVEPTIIKQRLAERANVIKDRFNTLKEDLPTESDSMC